MLARTAGALFWLARYMERADYLARLLQVAGHMHAVRGDQAANEWESALIAAGCQDEFFKHHDTADAEAVFHYLAFDTRNPSSIIRCFETARRNARAVRTALTAEMWEAVNGAWLELRAAPPSAVDDDQASAFLEWVKSRAGLFHGVCSNTMLRIDGFHFARLGQYLERADNSARLLDVKYHVTLPKSAEVGGLVDYYQWMAVLRVVAARRAFRVLFKGRLEPWHVAELLILRPEFPRSLTFCFEQITISLDRIQNQDPRRVAEAKRQAHALYAQLRFGRIDHIVQRGLHEYLSEMILATTDLAAEIAESHLF